MENIPTDEYTEKVRIQAKKELFKRIEGIMLAYAKNEVIIHKPTFLSIKKEELQLNNKR